MFDFVTREITRSTVVVEIKWVFDEVNREYLFDCITDLLDSGVTNIILECQGLGHLNSFSLATLLVARKKATRKGARICLTHLNSSLSEVLEITKLGQLLRVYPTTKDALASLPENMATNKDTKLRLAGEA